METPYLQPKTIKAKNTKTTKKNYTQQGFCKSGAFVLNLSIGILLNICAKLNICAEIPTFAKPENVICKPKRKLQPA